MSRLNPLQYAPLLVLLLGIGQWSSQVLATEAPLSWSRSAPKPLWIETPEPSPLPPSPNPIERATPKRAPLSAPATRVDTLIDNIAAELQLDARLVHAMIYVESRYNADALSSKGAMGLMQVMPSTGERFGYTDLRDPVTNVRAGATYLKWLLQHFDHNLKLALAGYNAGEGAVKKYGRSIPPYPETQNYVHQVMQRYNDGPIALSVFQPHLPSRTISPVKSSQPFEPNTIALKRLFNLLLSSPPMVSDEF
ncbi:lytic transglycosylase domain-containing protein [Pseudomonas zeae]|uniref:lytic transglycosylase domain-containing protein n=1 Tax=Pseudomonas zeae TaxID=2745510 RepID=UPI0039E13C35